MQLLTVPQQFQLLKHSALSIKPTVGGLQMKCSNDLTVYFTMALNGSKLAYFASYWTGGIHTHTNMTEIEITSQNVRKFACYLEMIERV